MPLRPFNREQAWLLPPTLDDLVPQNHPARFVAAFVDGFNQATWDELGIDLSGDHMGAGAYDPRALLSVWIYGFMTGVRTTRRLEAACREQVPYMWLAGMQKPDHNTLWRFFRDHRDRMRALLRRTVKTAVKAGLVDLALQAVDGTKIAGNASTERTFDTEGLKRLLERVEESVDKLEAQNSSDGGSSLASLPKELANAQRLRKRVKEALVRVESDEEGKYQNLTDGDAGLLKSRRGFVAGYNAQAMVAPLGPSPSGRESGRGEVGGTESGMLITAVDIGSDSDDHPQLMPMIEESERNTGGGEGTTTLADAGYHSGANLSACESEGYQVLMPEVQDRKRSSAYHKDKFVYQPEPDTYQCPEGQQLRYKDTFTHSHGYQVIRYQAEGEDCRACPAFGKCTKSNRGRTIQMGTYEPLLQEHRALMATDEAKRLYRRRKTLVEPVFGLLKECHGARRLHLRGQSNVLSEWSLIGTAFNLKSLHKIWSRAQCPTPKKTGVQRRRTRRSTIQTRRRFKRPCHRTVHPHRQQPHSPLLHRLDLN